MDGLDLTPALAAICYPFLLRIFHLIAGPPGTLLSLPIIIGSAVGLAGMFAVPALGCALANRARSGKLARRLAYGSVLAPTLYVFLGVLQTMAVIPSTTSSAISALTARE
jgi:hypothetical protein